MRFIATASISCVSREIEPRLIAPVTKRLTISLSDSTSSYGTGPPFAFMLNVIKPRNIACRVHSSLVCFENRQYASSLLVRAATCSSAIAAGSHMWRSPPLRQ